MEIQNTCKYGGTLSITEGGPSAGADSNYLRHNPGPVCLFWLLILYGFTLHSYIADLVWPSVCVALCKSYPSASFRISVAYPMLAIKYIQKMLTKVT